MEDWKKGFYESLLRFVRDELCKTDCVEVTRFEESAYERARHSEYTADSPYILVEFFWKDNTGKSRWTEWEGDFGKLISRLT